MVLAGFGETLLPKMIDYLKCKSYIKIKEMLTEVKKEIWLKWGEILFWWGCAPAKRSLYR